MPLKSNSCSLENHAIFFWLKTPAVFTNLENIHLKDWLANSENVDATPMHQVVEYKFIFCLYKKWYDKLTQSRMSVFSMEDYIDVRD